jgi:hypothetical protein
VPELDETYSRDGFVELGKSGSGPEPSLLSRVLDVFPTASVEHVKLLITNHNQNYELVLQHMLDKGYEKQVFPNSDSASSVADVEKPSIDFNSTSWDTSASYRSQAILILQNDFPYVRVDGLKSLFASKKFHYTPTFDAITKELNIPPSLDLFGRGCSVSATSRKYTQPTSAQIVAMTPMLEKLGLSVKQNLRLLYF